MYMQSDRTQPMYSCETLAGSICVNIFTAAFLLQVPQILVFRSDEFACVCVEIFAQCAAVLVTLRTFCPCTKAPW